MDPSVEINQDREDTENGEGPIYLITTAMGVSLGGERAMIAYLKGIRRGEDPHASALYAKVAGNRTLQSVQVQTQDGVKVPARNTHKGWAQFRSTVWHASSPLAVIDWVDTLMEGEA